MSSSGAIRAGRAFVELFADDSMLVRTLRRAEARVVQFGQKIKAIGRNLFMMGAAMGIPFAASMKTFASFDDQMRAVKAVTGATGKEFDDLTEKAKLLGRTTSFTAAQVASAMLELGRAGFSPTEIDKAIAAVLDLSRATGTELAQATEYAGNVLRSFELPAAEMGRVCDVLVAAANNSAQTLEDLGESMSYCAPIASEYGLSLEQTAKALGSLANYGIKGSQAGTTLRRILTNLADPSIQKRLKNLGVSVVDADTGKMRDVSEILRDLGKNVQNMPKDQKLGLFKELFDLYAIAGGGAVDWLKQQFGNLCSFATESVGAIAAALGRGDIEAAIQVVWASIKLIWTKGSTSIMETWYWVVDTLQTAWANCVFKISELLTTAWYGVQQIWTDSVYTMQATWIGFMNGIKQAWDYVSTGIAQGIGWIMAKIMGLDPSEMAATITEDYNNRTNTRQGDAGSSIDALAKERNEKIAALEKEKQGTLDILKQDFENAAGVRNAAYEAKLAAQAHRHRRMNLARHGAGFDSLYVYIENAAGKDLQRFDVVGLDGPSETQNLDIFCNRIVFKGIVPKKKQKGKFAVIQQDAAKNMVVRACVYGATIAKVKVTSNSEDDHEPKYCDVKEDETGYLESGGSGAEVLWSDDSTDNRWAIIRIGSGKSTLFPVKLEKTGGEQGDNEKVASWTYKVTDAMTDEKLEEDVDPTESPHQWKRPSIGAFSEATFGYAHYDKDDKLVLGWINEIAQQEACGEDE